MSARPWLFATALACAAGADAQQLRTYTQFPDGPLSLVYGLPVPLPLETLTPVDGFRSYASIEGRLQGLALASPDLAAHDVGRTVADRTVWAYVVSDENGTDVEGRPESAFFINASTHAREWATPEVSTGTIERMVAGAGDGGLVRYLLDNTRLVIIPVHNIDGVLQTQRYPTEALVGQDPEFPAEWPRDGRMRRKNMRGVDEVLTTTGDHLLGIDLNRNHPPFWALTTASSPNPNHLAYHGTGPHSEPENKALEQAATLAPETRIRLGFDLHTHAKVYFSANTGRARLNAIQSKLIERMIQHHAELSGKTYQDLPDPFVGGIGTADEYFATQWLVPSWTLEIEPGSIGAAEYGGTSVTHSGFILPASQAKRVRESWAETNLVAFYIMSGPAHLARVRYVDVATGAVAAQTRWRYDPATAQRERVEEVAGPLVPGRTYRIELGFSKPMRYRNEAGQVAQLPGAHVLLVPSVALMQGGTRTELDTTGGEWLRDPARVLRYADDTFAFEFTAPAGVGEYGLEVETKDMAMMAIDSDPSTPADWDEGAWSEYENAIGVDGDIGGADTQTVFDVDDTALLVTRAPSALAGEGDAVEADVQLPAAASAETRVVWEQDGAQVTLATWPAGESGTRTLRLIDADDVLVQGDRDRSVPLHLVVGGADTGVATTLTWRVLDNDSPDLVVLRGKESTLADFDGAPPAATRALVLDRRDYAAHGAAGSDCAPHRFDGPLVVFGNGARLLPGTASCLGNAVYDGSAGRVELHDLGFDATGATDDGSGALLLAKTLLTGSGDVSLLNTRFQAATPFAATLDPDAVLLDAGAGDVHISRSRFEQSASRASRGLRFENSTVQFEDSYVFGTDDAPLVTLDGGQIALDSATLDARSIHTPVLALEGGATASWRASLVQGEETMCNVRGTSLGFNVFADSSCATLQASDTQADVAMNFDVQSGRYAPTAIGPDLAGTACQPVDVRGAPRPQQPGDGEAPACDIGAFESGINPFRGIWGLTRPGHGIDLQTAGNRLVLVWYTHDEAGEPTAYQATAPFTGAHWEATLQQPSRDPATGQVTAADVGTITLDFSDATHAAMAWSIGTANGTDTMVASQFAAGAPLMDVTGLWYPPADSGHGTTVARRGNVTALANYYYDAQGKVRWALGTGTGADAQRVTMTWSNRSGELRPAGSMVAHFRTPRRARFELELVYPGTAGGTWNRAPADYIPISDAVDNDDALQ